MKNFSRTLFCIVLVVCMLSCICVNANENETEGIVSSHAKLPFEDIDETSWYVEGLTFCYTNGIISGAGNTYTFNPKGELTRATFAVMLARAVGADTSEYANSKTFVDCDYSATSWYAPAVESPAANGYMKGTSDTAFSPNVTMTREQLATVFMRFMQEKEYEVDVDGDVLDSYVDKDDVANWATDGVTYAISAGLISSTSTSNKVASPKMNVTRDQAAKLFMSLLRTYYYGSCEHQFSEAGCESAPTCSECGMVDALPLGHLCENLSCKAGGECKRCGETVEKDEGLHVYEPSTCTKAETCKECGGTRRGALGHNLTAATCLTPPMCRRCGEAVGRHLEHDFTEPTCIKPATCRRCGETDGGTIDHMMYNGACEVCGFDPFNVAVNIAKAGINCEMAYDYEGETFYSAVTYVAESDMLVLGLIHYYASGDWDVIALGITRGSKNIDYSYAYVSADEEILFECEGWFFSGTFSIDTRVTFSWYDGNDSNIAAAKENIAILGTTALYDCSSILRSHDSRMKLEWFGFWPLYDMD